MRGARRWPIRTCVGCRTPGEQRLLVRIAADPTGGVVVNPVEARGRGAYLCPSLDCFTQAMQRKAIPRALRRELSGLDQTALRAGFQTELSRRGLLAASRQALRPAARRVACER